AATEHLGRVGDALQTCPGHLEHTQLVRRAEAVLDGAEDAVSVIPVALELEHAVDKVLEDAGPATVPSFVTCPTRIVATPASFAVRNNRAAASRTCPTEPGAEPTSCE